MSASAAARQRLDNLLAQHREYREKLQAQEDELRKLQSLVLRTRTVVEFTLPNEMKRARREYMSTVDKCQTGNMLKQEYGTTAQILREKLVQCTSCLFVAGSNGGNSSSDDNYYNNNNEISHPLSQHPSAGPTINSLKGFSGWGWAHIVVILVSLVVAGMLSRSTSRNLTLRG